MKKTRILQICLLCALLLPVAAKAGDKKYVSVREAALRSGTGFFSEKVASVQYGAEVVVLEEGQKHSLVQTAEGGESGWIPSASLTKKKILDAGGVSVSSKELALAGKGFSAQIEGVFKSENSTLRYDRVDALESLSVSEEETISFMQEGGLLEEARDE